MNNTHSLGHLEIQILEQLWLNQEGTAKSVHAILLADRKITLNTVQSTLERLCRKGLLGRSKLSHSYVYKAIESKEVMLGQLIQDMLNRFENNSSLNIAAVINAAELVDEKALDLLEQEIKHRRQSEES
jgi:predicted transcriptional regulator